MDVFPAPPAPNAIPEEVLDEGSLASYLKAERHRLDQRVRHQAPGLETARSYSDLVDGVLRRTLDLACSEAGRGASADSVPIAIVATGGYGRRELCPHSDIDITFVPHRDGDPLVDRVIKDMFTRVIRVFMDRNGLEIGYAYRLLDDLASLDHQTSCGLLDARLVAGSSRIFVLLEHEYWMGLNPSEFLFEKLAERRRQLEDPASDLRLVEPNLKTGAGGLRDLQAAVWMVQCLNQVSSGMARGERAFEILQKHGGLKREQTEQIQKAKELVFRVRNALHVATGAERDQLVVTRQEEVAEMLGYAVERSDERTPVETMMCDLYDAMTTINRLSWSAIRLVEDSRIVLGLGLDCRRREIVSAKSPALETGPEWMLWAFEIAQRRGLKVSDDLAARIEKECRHCSGFTDPRLAGEILLRILQSKQPVYPTLQAMADLGLLGLLIPEFGQTLNLIPYDPSHDYTVGQHSLHVVRNLDELRLPGNEEDLRDLRLVMSDLPHPEQLFLAAALHDAGKAAPNRPHAEVGAEIAIQVCSRLGWPAPAAENVSFLVRQHLFMDQIARLRDLTLDETIREFTAVVPDLDLLNMLFLLTYADTSAVGAGVWTQVKGRFLGELYHRALREMSEEETPSRDEASLNRTRRRLLRELSLENLPPEEVSAHVEGMPTPYILNTSPEEMALHIAFAQKARQGEPVVDFHDERNATFTEITVCALDDPDPGLLSKIAGVLYAADLTVHSAQVYTRVGGAERIAIDRLFADYRGRQLTPGKRSEVAANLVAVLSGSAEVAGVLQKRRKDPAIGGPATGVTLRGDVSERFTVVEVTAADEQATLYRASGALSKLGWDIHSARVSLFSGKCVASFYVTGLQHMRADEAREALLGLMPVEK